MTDRNIPTDERNLITQDDVNLFTATLRAKDTPWSHGCATLILRLWNEVSSWKAVAHDHSERLKKLDKPYHEREAPHCSTCECGAVDVPAKVCVCGEPNTVGVQHRADGPCFLVTRPVANK